MTREALIAKYCPADASNAEREGALIARLLEVEKELAEANELSKRANKYLELALTKYHLEAALTANDTIWNPGKP